MWESIHAKLYLPFVMSFLIGLGLMSSCHTIDTEINAESGIYLANLKKGPSLDFANIRTLFQKNNPGYDLHYLHDIRLLNAKNFPRIGFIQKGGGTMLLSGRSSSKFSIGDLVMIPAEEEVRSDSFFSCLIFHVPDEWPRGLPFVIRPDWDERITDVPGGCATETNAYRRILLTWKTEVGPYIYKHLNAHRVRITNSFTHYHPKVGGFDEFYLVQMVRPEAKIITSPQLDLIINPENLQREQVSALLHETRLELDDLVYIPRGVVHRGIDSVLAQVITIPGFIPGAEIGVDYHLNQINQRFGLTQPDLLPFNPDAADTILIK